TGVNWGNVFGLDQILGYQYATDTQFKHYEAHSGSYWIPLPWRHVITLFGYDADIKPDFSVLGKDTAANFSQKARSSQASIQYSVPLPRLRKFAHVLWAGFDYKFNDSQILF